MARASGPPSASDVDARSDAARRGARPASGPLAGARRLGETGANRAAEVARTLAETGAPLVVRPGASMRPHVWWMDAIAVRANRHTMETVNRHLETMGSERLPRGANAGFERKAP